MKVEKRIPSVIPDHDHILHGGDYNPDQWLHRPEIIDEDFRLMPIAGCDTFSVGIFAWSALEPEEGVFQFDWMQDILDRMASAGHMVFLATPSGSMPVWLAEKYPEVCRAYDHTDTRDPWGMRHNHCPTSPMYRKYVKRINGELAKRFGSHPAVKMWHISNEYNAQCKCSNCAAAFRVWLKKKYGDIDTLNKAWWNMFWSHNLTDWEQITPYDPKQNCNTIHDGFALDWNRFASEQMTDFMKEEIAAVREYSDLPVTTNYMGRFPQINYWRMSEHIDIVSNDAYPCFSGREDDWMKARSLSFDADTMRSMNGYKPFILMESCITGLNWSELFYLKRPGVHRREMLQQIAHGADATLYFQYRAGRGGSEKMHGAVIGHEGTENPGTFKDVQAHSAVIEKIKEVTGTGVDAEVAVMYDWDCKWALEATHGPSQCYNDKGYLAVVNDHYGALWGRAVQLDIVEAISDFTSYKMVVAPMQYLMTEGHADKIKSFITNGGIWIMSGFSGWVDDSNRCHLGGWPGLGLREFTGIWAEEVDSLEQDIKVKVKGTGALNGYDALVEAERYFEQINLEADDIEVMAEYASEFYAGRPCIVRRKIGAGWLYYFAPQLTTASYNGFYDEIVKAHGLKALAPERPEHGIILRERQAGEDRYVFVINVTAQTRAVQLNDGSYTDMETGDEVPAMFEIAGNGSMVLKVN